MNCVKCKSPLDNDKIGYCSVCRNISQKLFDPLYKLYKGDESSDSYETNKALFFVCFSNLLLRLKFKYYKRRTIPPLGYINHCKTIVWPTNLDSEIDQIVDNHQDIVEPIEQFYNVKHTKWNKLDTWEHYLAPGVIIWWQGMNDCGYVGEIHEEVGVGNYQLIPPNNKQYYIGNLQGKTFPGYEGHVIDHPVEVPIERFEMLETQSGLTVYLSRG